MIPETQQPQVPQEFGFITQIDRIVGNIRGLVQDYMQMTGKNPYVVNEAPENARSVQSFQEARAAKKAEMASKEKPQNKKESEVFVMSELAPIIEGLIGSLKVMEKTGGAKLPLGQVIMNLPFNVEQTREFLEKFYQEHYANESKSDT